VDLLTSERVQNITHNIPNPDVQRPSLLVLIGNAAKTIALRELFGVKRKRQFSIKPGPAEIHLHIDPSSVFHEKPLLIAEGDLSEKQKGEAPTNKCHDVTRRSVRRGSELGPGRIASGVYARLLSPFADVFCFFCDDLGGLQQVARHLAAWLEHEHTSTRPASTRSRVVVVTEKIPLGAESEKQARTALLCLLQEETTRDLFEQVSAIDVIALFPNGSLSVDARYRPLKERLRVDLDQVRKNREDARSLFTMVHFAAFLSSAFDHFSNIEGPFDFIKASRVYNPVAPDLEEHLSHFLKHVRSPDKLTGFAAPVIASSLVLDNYPPGAHRRSSPSPLYGLTVT